MSIADSVRSRLGVSWRLLLKELSGFGSVGAVAFVVDLGLFQVLYAHAGLGAVTSRTISTLLSMSVAYVGHRYWSFSHRARTGVRREYVLFTLINGATLVLSLGIVWFVRYPLGQEHALVLQIANVVSVAVGTVLRYLSYRAWVFPAHDRVPGSEAAEPAEVARNAA